jgi:hypothetical protein
VSVRVRSALLVLVAALVVAATQVVSVPRVAADATGSDGHGTVRVGVSSVHSGSSRSAPHGSDSNAATPESCVYEPAPAYLAQALGIGGPLPGEWLLFGCPGYDFGLANSAAIIWTNFVWVTDALQRSVVADVADQAESSIRLPSPVIEADPSGTTFVNLATWLWISPSVWHPLTATATAGGVAATATATPVRVEFTTGDGGSVSCDGPGTPYDPREPSSAQTTSCFHIYKSSSADQESPDGSPNDAAYFVTATITWSVTWHAVGAPGGGSLPTLRTTASARLRVEQIESVDLP